MFKLTTEQAKNIKLGKILYGCEIESILEIAESKAETIEEVIAGYIIANLKEDLKKLAVVSSF